MELSKLITKLNLPEEENEKLYKFIAGLQPLTGFSEQDIDARLNLLTKNNIKISEMFEIKVLTNSLEDLEQRIGWLREIDCIDLAQNKPNILSTQLMRFYSRVKICQQKDIEFRTRDEEGTYAYKDFLFSDSKWAQFINSVPEKNINEMPEVPVEGNLSKEEPVKYTFTEESTLEDNSVSSVDEPDGVSIFDDISSILNGDEQSDVLEQHSGDELEFSSALAQLENPSDTKNDNKTIDEMLTEIQNSLNDRYKAVFGDAEPSSLGRGGR